MIIIISIQYSCDHPYRYLFGCAYQRSGYANVMASCQLGGHQIVPQRGRTQRTFCSTEGTTLLTSSIFFGVGLGKHIVLAS